MNEKINHNKLLNLYKNTPLTILKQIYSNEFNIDKITHNQLANLLAQLKIKPSDEKMSELQAEYEIKKNEYNDILKEKKNILKLETINKLKTTMKVKLSEVPLAEYCWKNVKHAFPCGMPFKDVGEMEVVKIDEETGNITVKRFCSYDLSQSYSLLLHYCNGKWYQDDRIRAELC